MIRGCPRSCVGMPYMAILSLDVLIGVLLVYDVPHEVCKGKSTFPSTNSAQVALQHHLPDSDRNQACGLRTRQLCSCGKQNQTQSGFHGVCCVCKLFWHSDLARQVTEYLERDMKRCEEDLHQGFLDVIL